MKQILIFMSLCVVLFYTSCESHKEEHHKETKFQVTSPVKLDTSIVKDYVCQVKAIRHIELRALEKGYLQDLYVDEGQFVKRGKLMFQIMPKLYKAEKKKAEAEANYAEIEYLNTKNLFESNVVGQNELALAKAKYDRALAELSLAQVHVGFTEIRAPFDGIMDRLQVRLGSLVNEGDLLTTLSDNSKMWVYFNVPEAEYLDYQSTRDTDSLLVVNLLMANNKMFEHAGIVETIEADFNNETGNIAFRATFPNPKGLLRHGETGNIQIVKSMKNALLIPQKATFEVLDKKFVYVVDKNNIIKPRQITVLSEMEDLFEIGAGLEENEKILLEGLRIVKADDKIDYEYLDPKVVFSHLRIHAE
ncbi:efflux RND transporter periplasmic adaptor subunit [Reichenbachiella agarivorans]|uniref:Efflux RND transporter periplasmic adaptor subunit n=1 Tax=Reichenbachiella agarivorans TaxID=2979464 RepID=A0ABY6CUK2_9BACT|nr:efflux RND transporter periplasmic adaptor subunit [Reichenbachiella agarivorans]UXP34186.1 efflux RND transporter periplasmic adaptor subunit [Reichenbachiella agarivorans]